MEMDKLGVITTFLHSIVVYNIPLLYGTVGEITVEKSGSLNLGVEGIMAVGAIFGYLVGCWTNNLLVGILTGFLAGALCGLLFAVLTVSLQANQNITGLTLTTFGLGVYFFVGNGVKAVSWPAMNDYANIKAGFSDLAIPGLSQLPVIGEGLFSHNILVYLAVVIALVMWWYMNRTTPGLRLRAVGENPGAADSVGVNVKRVKYLHICLGCGIMGIGGYHGHRRLLHEPEHVRLLQQQLLDQRLRLDRGGPGDLRQLEPRPGRSGHLCVRLLQHPAGVGGQPGRRLPGYPGLAGGGALPAVSGPALYHHRHRAGGHLHPAEGQRPARRPGPQLLPGGAVREPQNWKRRRAVAK